MKYGIAICMIVLLLTGCGSAAANNSPLLPLPLPTRPPFPTPQPVSEPRSTVMQTVMRLPDVMLGVDAAAHPLTGDPVVAAIAAPLTTSGTPHAFVRAYDGATGLWRTTQNVDVGAAELGDHRFRSVAVTVTGSGELVVVWGATALPELGVWASSSTDYGETWTPPVRLMTNSFGVLDVASTLDGQIVVLAVQRTPLAAVVITRDGAGMWQPPEALPVAPVWYASSGAVVIAEEGAQARIVALTTAATRRPGTMLLASRPLAGGAWQVGAAQVPTPTTEGLLTNVRAVAFGQQVSFVMGLRDASSIYSITSTDGGVRWSLPRLITDAGGTAMRFPAVAYDPVAQRLLALWGCCADARYNSAASTHYAGWSMPGEEWKVDITTPVVTGAMAAADTVIAQAHNSRSIWLVWVEGGTTIAARALDLNTLIPTSEYLAGGTRP